MFKQLVFLVGIVNLISCSNFSMTTADECLHISEVNVIDGLILHDGKPYSGVLFETDHNYTRLYHKIQSPIQIKGLSDVFKGKVGYAMTVVNGVISGPFATMYNPYDRNRSGEELPSEYRDFLGRYYSYEIDSRRPKLDCSPCATIRGTYSSGNLSIFESNGELRCTIERGLNLPEDERSFTAITLQRSLWININDCTLTYEYERPTDGYVIEYDGLYFNLLDNISNAKEFQTRTN